MRYSPRPATIVGSGSNPRPYTVYAKQDEARASERVDELSVGELSVVLAGGGWSMRCSPTKGSEWLGVVGVDLVARCSLSMWKLCSCCAYFVPYWWRLLRSNVCGTCAVEIDMARAATVL
jgi:hypothetical protein